MRKTILRRYSREWGGANGANLTFFLRDSRKLKNLNFGGYLRHVNQSGACSSIDVITSGGRKSQTSMEDKFIVVVCGYPELYIHLHTFTKTGIHFATRLELPGRSPSHDANSRLLCSEFHLLARMARVNSKCSSVQLRANSAIFSRHSRLVWTHLEAGVKASRATTHRRVKEFGYNCRQRRLIWAKEKKNWTVAQWSKILFSDESNICI